MARRQFFSGNYGSALGSYDTAARLLAGAGQAQGKMFANLGADIGGAIEKYGLNKEKAETADMMIGAYLENMSPDDLTELQTGTSEIGKTLNKFIDGELPTSKKVAFAGALGVMLAQREKRKTTESTLALQAAQTAAALRGTPVDPALSALRRAQAE